MIHVLIQPALHMLGIFAIRGNHLKPFRHEFLRSFLHILIQFTHLFFRKLIIMFRSHRKNEYGRSDSRSSF